jgi:hypothetical protein
MEQRFGADWALHCPKEPEAINYLHTVFQPNLSRMEASYRLLKAASRQLEEMLVFYRGAAGGR